jgi:hypothetical protein
MDSNHITHFLPTQVNFAPDHTIEDCVLCNLKYEHRAKVRAMFGPIEPVTLATDAVLQSLSNEWTLCHWLVSPEALGGVIRLAPGPRKLNIKMFSFETSQWSPCGVFDVRCRIFDFVRRALLMCRCAEPSHVRRAELQIAYNSLATSNTCMVAAERVCTQTCLMSWEFFNTEDTNNCIFPARSYDLDLRTMKPLAHNPIAMFSGPRAAVNFIESAECSVLENWLFALCGDSITTLEALWCCFGRILLGIWDRSAPIMILRSADRDAVVQLCLFFKCILRGQAILPPHVDARFARGVFIVQEGVAHHLVRGFRRVEDSSESERYVRTLWEESVFPILAVVSAASIEETLQTESTRFRMLTLASVGDVPVESSDIRAREWFFSWAVRGAAALIRAKSTQV